MSPVYCLVCHAEGWVEDMDMKRFVSEEGWASCVDCALPVEPGVLPAEKPVEFFTPGGAA